MRRTCPSGLLGDEDVLRPHRAIEDKGLPPPFSIVVSKLGSADARTGHRTRGNHASRVRAAPPAGRPETAPAPTERVERRLSTAGPRSSMRVQGPSFRPCSEKLPGCASADRFRRPRRYGLGRRFATPDIGANTKAATVNATKTIATTRPECVKTQTLARPADSNMSSTRDINR